MIVLDASAERFAASPLTLAEVLVGPARVGKLEAAQAAIRTLGVEIVPLDQATLDVRLAMAAAELGLGVQN